MKTGNTASKSAVGLALATPFLLVWMIGAVGVLGREGDRADLMYIGVFAAPNHRCHHRTLPATWNGSRVVRDGAGLSKYGGVPKGSQLEPTPGLAESNGCTADRRYSTSLLVEPLSAG